jgi:hypothetical protein
MLPPMQSSPQGGVYPGQTASPAGGQAGGYSFPGSGGGGYGGVTGGIWQGGALQGGYTPWNIEDPNTGEKIRNPVYQPRYFQWVRDWGPGSNESGWRLKQGTGGEFFNDTSLPTDWKGNPWTSSYSPEFYRNQPMRGSYDRSKGWNFHPGANLWRPQQGQQGWMPGWGTLQSATARYQGQGGTGPGYKYMGGPGPTSPKQGKKKDDQFPEDPIATAQNAGGFVSWKP